MSPIVYVVVSGALAVFALLILAGIIAKWFRRKDARRAVDHLCKLLERGVRKGGLAEVSPISVRPLSIEMTKEAATMSGYEFVDYFNRNGSELMRFRPASGSQKVARPHV